MTRALLAAGIALFVGLIALLAYHAQVNHTQSAAESGTVRPS
jgi:hypothetical protein